MCLALHVNKTTLSVFLFQCYACNLFSHLINKIHCLLNSLILRISTWVPIQKVYKNVQLSLMSTLGWPIRHHTTVAMLWLKSVFLPYSKTASVGQAFPIRVLQAWSHLLPSPLPKPLLNHMASFTLYVQKDKHSSACTREQTNFKQSQAQKNHGGGGGAGVRGKNDSLASNKHSLRNSFFFL